MSVQDTIDHKLRENLSPRHLEVIDESHLHKGHMGARPEGETHFRVSIVSTAFEGMARVARHQKVYGILKEELAGPVHALALTTLTPEEHEKKT